MLQKWAGENLKTVRYVNKGMNCGTEMYSVMAAEVPLASDPSTFLNQKLMAELQTADQVSSTYHVMCLLFPILYVSLYANITMPNAHNIIYKRAVQLIVCGQALSHCVNYSTRDIVDNWKGDKSQIIVMKDGACNICILCARLVFSQPMCIVHSLLYVDSFEYLHPPHLSI